MAGEYREEKNLKQIRADLAEPIRRGQIRIARTDVPIIGAVKRSDLNDSYAAEYKRIGLGDISERLTSGKAIVIEIPTCAPTQTYWAPGELFLRS